MIEKRFDEADRMIMIWFVYVEASKQQTGIGLDLGVARGLGVSSPALHGMPQLQQQKNQWVTVFGYPMGAGAEVLRHFQACGEVHQHRSEPGKLVYHLLNRRRCFVKQTR